MIYIMLNVTPYIQIAGVLDQAEADMLISCGVYYLGFPLRLPVHKEDLSEQEACNIIKTLSPPCHGVLITYLNQAQDILDFCNFLGTSIIQLHGDICLSELRKIKNQQPNLTLIKSLVIGLSPISTLLRMLEQFSPYVDAYITDTFDPKTGASGATGKTHDWRISQRFVKESPRPVILAGGLTPQNVREAILEVKPHGVDTHTGIEDPSGRKNYDDVKTFVAEALEAFHIVNSYRLNTNDHKF